eukprot:m51a1_g1550 hypothetical protein (204) ;mRNA; r:576354-582844
MKASTLCQTVAFALSLAHLALALQLLGPEGSVLAYGLSGSGSSGDSEDCDRDDSGGLQPQRVSVAQVAVLSLGLVISAVCLVLQPKSQQATQSAATFRSPTERKAPTLCQAAAFVLSLAHLALALQLLSAYKSGVAAGYTSGSGDSGDCSEEHLQPQGVSVVQVAVLCLALVVSTACVLLLPQRHRAAQRYQGLDQRGDEHLD